MQVGPYELFPHQERAISETRQAVAKLRAAGLPPRVLLVGPCGVGKTIMSSALMSLALEKENACAFLAHGRQLIFQKSAKLQDCGIQHSVLMDGEEYYHSRCTVASKDTYWSRSFVDDRVPKLNVKMLIVDEAHQSIEGSWRTILEHNPETIIIGLTATPARGNGTGLGDFYKAMVTAATYEELLAAKPPFLVPPRIYAPYSVDMSGAKVGGPNHEYVQHEVDSRFNKPELVGDVIAHWIRLAENRPTAVFASSVKHSIALAAEFNRAGIAAKHMDADTDQAERLVAFQDLKEGRLRVITNYAIVRVGVDLPFISCLQLAVAMNSLNTYLQTCGRGFRTHPGKTECIIIDHGGNVHKHGWPTEDHEWSLDGKETVQVRDEKKEFKEKKPREPICCPKCGAMRESGPTCHNCGHKHARTGLKVRMVDGTLKEVQRKAKPRPLTDHQKVYSQCLAVAANRNMTAAAAKAMFKNKTGAWPGDELFPKIAYSDNNTKVALLYPGFVRGRKAAN